MSTLSQFIGGSDANTLKLKNGSTLDEIHGYTNVNIRDFTAQNDHLMISMTDRTVYIGKRFNELLQCVPNDSNQLFTTSNDLHIGGDPFPTQLNRFTTGIATYQNPQDDAARVSNSTTPHKSVYFPQSANFATTSSNNIANNARNQHVKRFIYSGDDLFYISWNHTSNELRIYDFSTGAPVAATYTYSGSQGLSGSQFSVISDVNRCTYPEIDPATGDIVMYMRIGNAGYRLTYDHSANTWQFSDTTFGFSGMSSQNPYHISINGSNIFMAAEVARATYFYSTDGGDNWTSNNVQTSDNWYFKGSGFANGAFYTINCEGASGSEFHGNLMRSTDLINWTFVDHSGASGVNMIRNNGLGTACYISNGHSDNDTGINSNLMAKIT